MYKESADRLQGNDAFEGYGIDLIAEISQILSKEVNECGLYARAASIPNNMYIWSINTVILMRSNRQTYVKCRFFNTIPGKVL